jgi:hypothetical protein
MKTHKTEAVPPKVMKLLQLLQDRTIENGCTEAEMRESAAKIKQLLQEHDLTLMDVDTKQITTNAVESVFVSTYGHIPPAYLHLATQIAKAFECKMIYEECRGNRDRKAHTKLHYLGMEADVEVCLFFYPTLWNKLDKLCREGIRGNGLNRSEHKSYRHSFYVSAADALYQRLAKERTDTGTTGTEIVLAKNVKIKELQKQIFPYLRAGKQIGASSHSLGSQDGYNAGRTMHLTRGVTGGSNGTTPKGLPG